MSLCGNSQKKIRLILQNSFAFVHQTKTGRYKLTRSTNSNFFWPKNHLFKRWILAEFFYSAIDACLFYGPKNNLKSLIEIFKLSTKMTRSQWRLVRKSLFGKPRRLSRSFLKAERTNLNSQRTAARCAQQEKIMCVENLSGYIPLAYSENFQVLVKFQNRIAEGCIIRRDSDYSYKVRLNGAIQIINDVDIMPAQPIIMIPLSAFFELNSSDLLNTEILSAEDKLQRSLAIIERNFLLAAEQMLINKKIITADNQLGRYLTVSLAIVIAAFDDELSTENRKIVTNRLVRILLRGTHRKNLNLIDFIKNIV